jgi:probable rRNA maturation factor
MVLVSESNNYSLSLDCPAAKIPKSFFELPFSKLIKDILGEDQEVSIVFVRESKIKKLNKEFRKKNHSTDILSFNLGGLHEIFISINDVRKKAKIRGENVENYLSFLLIHGLLHLKGLSHGVKMESTERKLHKNLNEQIQNNSRNRHGDVSSAGYSRRTRRNKRDS